MDFFKFVKRNYLLILCVHFCEHMFSGQRAEARARPVALARRSRASLTPPGSNLPSRPLECGEPHPPRHPPCIGGAAGLPTMQMHSPPIHAGPSGGGLGAGAPPPGTHHHAPGPVAEAGAGSGAASKSMPQPQDGHFASSPNNDALTGSTIGDSTWSSSGGGGSWDGGGGGAGRHDGGSGAQGGCYSGDGDHNSSSGTVDEPFPLTHGSFTFVSHYSSTKPSILLASCFSICF